MWRTEEEPGRPDCPDDGTMRRCRQKSPLYALQLRNPGFALSRNRHVTPTPAEARRESVTAVPTTDGPLAAAIRSAGSITAPRGGASRSECATRSPDAPIPRAPPVEYGGRDRRKRAADNRPGDHVEGIVDADMHARVTNQGGRGVNGNADDRELLGDARGERRRRCGVAGRERRGARHRHLTSDRHVVGGAIRPPPPARDFSPRLTTVDVRASDASPSAAARRPRGPPATARPAATAVQSLRHGRPLAKRRRGIDGASESESLRSPRTRRGRAPPPRVANRRRALRRAPRPAGRPRP